MADRTPAARVFGWDVGGAHVKACVMESGRVVEVVQWACPLWQGMEKLQAVLQSARARWPGLDNARHAVTMTGEMVDLFANREHGVTRISVELASALSPPGSSGSIAFYAGDAGWCDASQVAARWEAIASANWLATARHAALHVATHAAPRVACSEGLLVDIGSTTTDLVAFRGDGVLTTARSDAERLASGELVYHGVVRTPLCAIARRIDWGGVPHNVMNEFFATSADVYRLTGELDSAHDLHPPADNAGKDLAATRQRLARMIGLDARDASDTDWLIFARAWRAAQVAELRSNARRVMQTHGLGPQAVIVSAGCGAFLAADVLAHDHRLLAYGSDIADVADSALQGRACVQSWAQVCAPSVAVAALCEQDLSRCGS
ncbi:hydantoinase/oxoprolinase family protein [soil metagenome]